MLVLLGAMYVLSVGEHRVRQPHEQVGETLTSLLESIPHAEGVTGISRGQARSAAPPDHHPHSNDPEGRTVPTNACDPFQASDLGLA
jgi:hypothetical protein